MRTAIWSWAETEGGIDAQWGRQTAPTLSKPFTSLTVITPPRQDGRPSRHCQGVALRLTSFEPNTLYRISVDGANADYTTGLTGTITEVRDALLPIAHALSQAVDVTTWGSDALIFAAAPGEFPVITSSGPLVHKVVDHYLGEAIINIGVDVFAPGRGHTGAEETPKIDALEVSSKLTYSLDSPDVLEFLRVNGWAVVAVVAYRETDMYVGGQWESRSGFDLRLRCRTRFSREFDFIEFWDGPSIQGTFEV